MAGLSAALAAAWLMASLTAAAQPAAPPKPVTLSAVEREKINRLIADNGSEVRLNNETTNLLGVTKNDELLVTRGVGVKDAQGDIHQFEPLAGDKGYLLLKITPQLNTIYWLSKDFAAISARARVPGQSSTALPVAEVEAGAARELAFWAAFADATP
jgi:hypothetical protein